MGWTAFANFCIKAGIPDKKGCPLATIDRVFIVVDQPSEEVVPGKLAKNMMRFEFLEGLVRIANCKYKETGVAATVTESFSLLIDECIAENFEFQPWQEFRAEDLWTLRV